MYLRLYIPHYFLVLFEIELLSFVDYRAADEFTAFSREERENATLDQIIAVANAEKDVSNIRYCCLLTFFAVCNIIFHFPSLYRLATISFRGETTAKQPANIVG